MAFSFLVNRNYVFRPSDSEIVFPVIKFLWVTAFSCYVLQNSIIFLASYRWTFPARLARWVGNRLQLLRSIAPEIIEKNIVKCLSVMGGIAWNFIWYKFYVFP